MKKLNFLTGLLNRMLSIILAIVAVSGLVIFSQLSVEGFIASIADLWTTTLGLVAILIVAFILYIFGIKGTVKSAVSEDYTRDKKKRYAGAWINLIIIAALIAVAGLLWYKAIPSILELKVTYATLLLITSVLTLVQFALLISKLCLLFKHQHVGKVRVKVAKPVKIKEPKVKKEKVKKEKKIKVKKNEKTAEKETEIVTVEKKNTESLVEPRIRFRKK